MKSGTISIILGTIGVLFIIWFNYQTYELYESLFLETQNNFLMEPTIVTTGKSYKIISLGMALFGILFGLNSVRKKDGSGKIGIVLSIIALIFAYLPIWSFFIN